MFGQDDPEENLSFVDEEDEEDIELPSGSVIPSTTSDSGVIGYIKNIKELKIGKGALDFFASENGFRGAVSKVRLKTSGRYVKHMGPSGKSFLVENHLNALLIGLFYLFATNFGLRNVMDAVRHM